MSSISAFHTSYTIAKKHSERQAKQEQLAQATNQILLPANMIVANEMFGSNNMMMESSLAPSNTAAIASAPEHNQFVSTMKQATLGGVDMALIGAVGFFRGLIQPSSE